MSDHAGKIIVLGSVLKPVDEPRMYEKIALTLDQTNKYDINIIGFYSKNIPVSSNIRFYPIYTFKRLSLGRFFAPWKFFGKLIKIKPKMIIVHTHELLVPALIYRVFRRSKVYYDVQENYGLNILQNKDYPRWFRLILSTWVRIKENMLGPFVAHFFLAERSYADQLSFIRDKYSFVLNKFKQRSVQSETVTPFQFIYSGTISESYGIYDSIDLILKLHELEPRVRLLIIGHTPKESTLEKIKVLADEYDFIELIGGTEPVPHQQILESINRAHIGLVPHHLDPSIIHCFPSKIYEYLAFRKPMVIRDHQPWVSYAEKYQAAIVTDFKDAQKVLNQIKNGNFYPNGIDQDIFWEEEGKKVCGILNKE